MLLVFLSFVAFADIPPPSSHTQTCSVQSRASPLRECASCEGFHGGREPCEKLEKLGYSKACQSGGASVWTEVLCKDRVLNIGTPTIELDAGKTAEEPAKVAVGKPGKVAKKASATQQTETNPSKCSTLSSTGALTLAFLPLWAVMRIRRLAVA